MSSTPKFAHVDTKKPDGFYVQFTCIIEDDPTADAPDEQCDGYWPSLDTNDPGYIGSNDRAELTRQYDAAQQRMDDWRNGDWRYVGVRARALCMIVHNGVGTHVNIDSAGIWGIESDAGDYLNEVYQDEISNLKDMLARMVNPQFEEAKT